MKFLVVGLGSIGSRHARNLLSLGQEVWVVRRSAVWIGPNLGLESLRRFDTLTEALNQKPDALVICNPTSFHSSIAIEAAPWKIPMFIEKPIATDLETLGLLEQAVKTAHIVPVMVGHNYRFHPGLKWLKEQLDAKRIGSIRQIRAEAGEYLPDWHPWEDYHISYIARQDLGGGCLLNFCHEIDDVLWIVGSSPLSVTGTQENSGALSIPVDETASVFMTFSSGAQAEIYLSIRDQNVHRRLQIRGENGNAGWDYFGGQAWIEPVGQARQNYDFQGLERNVMYLEEMRHFVDAVAARRPTSVSLNDGRRLLEVIDGVRQAQREKTHVA